MSITKQKPPIDGASLSPLLKPEPGATTTLLYKHAVAKSSTYNPQVVDMIYHMSRNGVFGDGELGKLVATKLAAGRKGIAPTPAVSFDQLVFVSANLTRLVIDPYREKCNSQVVIGPDRPKPLKLQWPVYFDGVDFGRLPDELFQVITRTASEQQLAYASSPRGSKSAQQIVRIDINEPYTTPGPIGAIELTAKRASDLTSNRIAATFKELRKQTASQIPIGITAPAFNAAQVVDRTIELEPDFYLADGQWIDNQRPEAVFPELQGGPSISVLADLVGRLRHHKREELTQVIYRGGIRDGADAGKVLCLGASAAALGLSAVLGMGLRVTCVDGEEKLIEQLIEHAAKPMDVADCCEYLTKFAASVNGEVTIMARACGKSSVSNMEPEDLRALAISVSAATGVPMAGKEYNFRVEG